MGGLHPAEYFAESVLIPDTVIVKGPGYTGPDGRSIMPSYTDSLSVAQLVDLVAYLRSLTAGGPHGDAGHGPDVSH
jgi:mono/diheme cytochrome c family protein